MNVNFAIPTTPQTTKVQSPTCVCTEKLYQEAFALIQAATLYDTTPKTFKSADMVQVIDNITKVLAYWRGKLTDCPQCSQESQEKR